METKMKQTFTNPLPIPKRVLINSPSEMPNSYGTTPGGTVFSTTPGGTRIIYDRQYLLNLRNSPLSRTPPSNLNHIEGVTKNISPRLIVESNTNAKEVIIIKEVKKDGEQFDMEL